MLRRAHIVGALTVLCMVLDPLVLASFTSAPNGPNSVTTAQLAAPTSVSAVRGTCSANTSVTAKVSWTASTSSQTTGYEIFRTTTSGSGYVSVGTATASPFTDTSVTFSTRYYYVVQSSRYLWRSVNSNEDPMTTPNLLCVGGSNT